MDNNIEALRASLGKLGDRDRSFAQSLLDQAATRGLSDKQLPWVGKLVERATTPPAAIGPITGIVELLARPGKRRARITLQVDDGPIIRLAVAGAASSEPGSVVVTSADRGFDNRKFYGRISKNGQFTGGRDATAETLPGILGLLRALALDPAGVAAAYGKLTGNCCFCDIPLTTDGSLEVGYGPVCAKKMQLPWGVAKAA